jgi:membrane protein implicated in regulation of membrane protease activity
MTVSFGSHFLFGTVVSIIIAGAIFVIPVLAIIVIFGTDNNRRFFILWRSVAILSGKRAQRENKNRDNKNQGKNYCWSDGFHFFALF